MIRHIIILRHGKAERDSPSRGDDDRALQPRGRYQAEFIAEALMRDGPSPTLIVTSPILRAKTTAGVIADLLRVRLLEDDRLSTRHDEQDHFACLRDQAEDHPCVMLVGHNPTLSSLAAQLTRTDAPPPGSVTWQGELRTGEALIFESSGPVRLNSAMLRRSLRLDRDD